MRAPACGSALLAGMIAVVLLVGASNLHKLPSLLAGAAAVVLPHAPRAARAAVDDGEPEWAAVAAARALVGALARGRAPIAIEASPDNEALRRLFQYAPERWDARYYAEQVKRSRAVSLSLSPARAPLL